MTQTTASNDLSAGSSQLLLNEPRRKFVATGPNQIWVWGVTSYHSPDLTQTYYCYLCEDIYSRYVVCYGLSPDDDVYSAVQVIYMAMNYLALTCEVS